MATHSSALAWRIPWTGELGGLQFMGLQRVKQDLVTEHIRILILYIAICKTDNQWEFAD